MPLVFLFIGVVFLILARNGTQGDFETLLKKEFSGSQSFLVWASALVILGIIGFWKTARPISDALIGLILFVLIVENKGFFNQFNAAIRNPVAPPATDALAATPAQVNTFNGATQGTLLNPGSTPSTLAPGMVPALP